MSKGAKAQAVGEHAEEALVEALFAPVAMEASGLTGKDSFVAFAKQVGDVLYEGQAPYHIPAFFAELTRGLTKSSSAEDVKKIVDSVTLIYNKKLAEKTGRGKQPNKGKKPVLAGAGKNTQKNNNQAMVNALMGSDSDEDDVAPMKREPDLIDDEFM